MQQKHIDIIKELVEEARKLDRYCMTSTEWNEFEMEIYDELEVTK